MNKLVLRYVIVLAGVLATSWLYSLACVPWIEGTVDRSREDGSAASKRSRVTRDDEAELRQLLPPEAWEFGKCIRLETEQGQLFFQDYRQLDDQRLEVEPLTVIFQPQDADGAARPTLLRSPAGAILRFSENFSLGASQVGDLEYAWLSGEVRIFRPAEAGRDNALELLTSNITVNKQRITTPNQVRFSYGPHRGGGQNLTLEFVARQEGDESQSSLATFGDLGLLEVVNLDEMVLAGNTEEEPVGGLSANEPQATVVSHRAKRATGSVSGDHTPVTIRCSGPFRFDFQQLQASFAQRVQVKRPLAGAPRPDELQCDLLVAQFTSRAAQQPLESDGRMLPSAADASAMDRMKDLALASLQAYGSPAHFQIPSQNADAHAEAMLYEPDTGRIYLQGDQPIRLQHDQQTIEAYSVEYWLREDGRLGNANAQGPGRMRRAATADQAALEITWQDELKIRPDQGLKAISLYGNPALEVGRGQTFQAGEVHLWVDEVDATTGQSANGMTRQQQAEAQWRILPVKMLAIGDEANRPRTPLQERAARALASLPQTAEVAERAVLFDSPRTTAATDHLEVFFARPRFETKATDTRIADDSLSSSADPATGAGQAPSDSPSPLAFDAQANPEGDERMGKFICSGDLTRLRLSPRGESFEVQELTVGGMVWIREVPPAETDDLPLEVRGHVLQATSRGANFYYLIVRGADGEYATVAARGLALEGQQINLDQLTNQVWIEGPGEAQLTQASQALNELNQRSPQLAGQRASYDRPTRVQWREQMTFDGIRVEVTGNVQSEGTRWTVGGERTDWQAVSERLELTLTERIRLAETDDPSPKPAADLRRLKLQGNVRLASDSFDPQGQLAAQDVLQIPNLSIDQLSGELEAIGAGTATTVRQESGSLLPEQLESSTDREASFSPAENNELTYLQIQFAGGIVGNVLRREVQFVEDVDAIVGPISDWDQTLDRDLPLHAGPVDHVRLLCDRLLVTEWTDDETGQGTVEVQGLGNAFLAGRGYEATGTKIAFNQLKDMLLLEGDQHAYAKLLRHSPGTGTGDFAEAMKIIYWRSQNRIEGDFHRFNATYTGRLSPPRRLENR